MPDPCEVKQNKGQEEVRMSQKRCKECGREYEYSSSGYDPFCSEGCRARAHKRYQEEYLEKMQKKGKLGKQRVDHAVSMTYNKVVSID
jgi:hypothetical protein